MKGLLYPDFPSHATAESHGRAMTCGMDGTRGAIPALLMVQPLCARSQDLSPAHRYFITIADLAKARGPDPDLSFQGSSPQSFAEALQAALRQPVLFQRWKARQPDPDEVDQSLAPIDPDAIVTAELADLHTDVQVVTTLTHSVLRHRLFILIGPNWQLRDVAAT